MSIQNISGGISTYQTSDINAVNTSTTSASSVPPAMAGAETASISTPGQFFSELQQLSQSNPTEFKQVASQLATSFQNAASSATGADAKRLTALANSLSQASQTGTLQPPQPPPGAAAAGQAGSAGGSGGAHHHHHHHGGGGGGGGGGQSSAMNQAFTDAMSILTQSLSSSSSSTSTSTATTLTDPSQTST